VDPGKTIQFKIGEFVTPTHAIPTVTFEVENGTGQASINSSTGILTGVAPGTVIVKITSTDNPALVKKFNVTVKGTVTALDEVNTLPLSIYPTWADAGENIHITGIAPLATVKIYNLQGKEIRQTKQVNTIETYGLTSGMYLAVISVDGKQTVKKFGIK
jgi:hypothetical protein